MDPQTQAARLFALALKAGEEGRADEAEELTRMGNEMLMRGNAKPVTQQQQQPQPDDPDKKE